MVEETSNFESFGASIRRRTAGRRLSLRAAAPAARSGHYCAQSGGDAGIDNGPCFGASKNVA